MKEDLINRIDGNGNTYSFEVPRIRIFNENINDIALQFIFKNTGLIFTKVQRWSWYEAEPTTALQIVTLLCTCDFKTRYYGNKDNLMLLILCDENEFFK